ncbi:EamA family transporter [Candidatus Poribacteria bacterium]|nr:EamA family transporter [Candidatus Poribacteria bacterium]
MNPLAIALVLLSTFMHASWNLMARHGRSEHDFFERMQIGVILIGLIPGLSSEFIARSIPPRVWPYVTISGLSCGLYYLSLANAYSSGDFTTVYPVARALPVLLMGLVDLARGRTPTAAGWTGMFLVVVGCSLSPLESIKRIDPRRYLNRTSLWMFLTAMGTVGYSTFDKLSSELVKQGPATAARYGYFFYTIAGLSYMLMRRLFAPEGKREGKPAGKLGWKMPILGGIFNFGAYWLVLWAYQLAGRASYVVAFRQFSIVIGSLAAFILYREKGFAVRMTAVSTITLGLIIIVIWGT